MSYFTAYAIFVRLKKASVLQIKNQLQDKCKQLQFLLSLLLLLLLLLIYFVLTSIKIYSKNLHSCSFNLIQVNTTTKYTIKLKR